MATAVLSPAETPEATEVAEVPGPRPRTVVALFAGLSLLFGTVFALMVPSAWGPDEHTHFKRAYQVSQGGFAPERLPDEGPYPVYGGAVPATAQEFMAEHGGAPRSKERNSDPLYTATEERARALDAPLAGEHVLTSFSNTAAYSPVPYLPSALGARIATAAELDIGTAWTLMRMLQVLAYTAVASVGLWALRGTRFLWVGFCVALLPTALFQSAVISADSVTNAVVLAFTAIVLRATVLDRSGAPLTRAELGTVLASAVALPLMKPTYVILSLLLLAVPLRKYPLPRRRDGRPVAASLVLTGCLLLTLLGFAVWMSLAAGTTEAMGALRGPEERHTVRPGDQLAFVLGEPVAVLGIAARTILIADWDYAAGFVGQMGYGPGRTIDGPFVGAVCWLVAVGAAFFHGPRTAASRRVAVWFAAVLLLNVAAIFGTLYLSFAPVESGIVNGVQGRYFVPLALLLLGTLVPLVHARFPAGPAALRRVDTTILVLVPLSVVLAMAGYATVVHITGHYALP
ncbi:DUF2142 domain-containing protein [Kocuria sp. CPCC 205268]|uniref:DUF2142 domain-containing protein n=1 Tax=Kocuria oxytropis TaxID=3058913 RepID=UPI0034D72DD5